MLPDRRITTVTAFVVGAAVLIGGATWAYGHRPGRFIERRPLDTNRVSTDGWQTFTSSNPANPFTFQYPSTLQLSKESTVPNPDPSLRPTQLVSFRTPEGAVAGFGFEQTVSDTVAIRTLLPDPIAAIDKLTTQSGNDLAGSHYTYNRAFLERGSERTVVISGGYFRHTLWSVAASVFENGRYLHALTTCGLEATQWPCDERLLVTILSTVRLPK